jgi:Domain of unknown function (DUF1707)
VTAGPGGGITVASRGHLRAAHADREQVIDTLKAAFVQGRLAKDEFDMRLGQTFAARTYADLAAVTADIPAELAGAGPAGAGPAGAGPAGAGPGGAGRAAVQPLREPVRALTQAEKAAAWGMYGIVLTVMLTIAVVPGQATIRAIVVTAAVIYFAWLLGGLLIVASRHGSRRPQARGGASLPPRG